MLKREVGYGYTDDRQKLNDMQYAVRAAYKI